MHRILIAFLLAVVQVSWATAKARSTEPPRPNFLLITVDDMNCDSVGAFGCELKGTTPHIDRLAAQGMRFEYAHVQVASCMPSRNVMWSGRYPRSNRVIGFHPVKATDYPVLSDLMKANGYFTAIRGKVQHSTPYAPYDWDMVLDAADQDVDKKDQASYYSSTRLGIEAAKQAGKPFCVMVNISDPHEPFYAMTRRGEPRDDPHTPSRTFTPEEVPVPGFLFDHPDVRKELAHYYSSVRRADDCLGAVIKALDESGERENTLVLFLSDHGMPLPFGKTTIYHHGTRTPLIVCQPGITESGSVDRRHMVSAVDLLPTILDAAGIAHPPGFDGRSFHPLLRGKEQDGRDMIFKEYNEFVNGDRQPMRGVQTRKYCYMFNPWSDGKEIFWSASSGTLTFRKMSELARSDELIAARLDLFRHRVVEELYDVENDPDSLHNLINDPAHKDTADRLRKSLEEWMVKTDDHALAPFRSRHDTQVLAEYMKDQKSQAEQR